MSKIYKVFGLESGIIEYFDTLDQAFVFIKNLKKFDKRHGINDTYYIEEVIDDE